MNRYRSLAGILMLALTLGFVTLGLQSSSSAKGYHADVPTYKVVRSKLIQGVTLDQRGRAILGVTVKAVNADGDVVASDSSYENTDANGDAQRGYFALLVGTNGVYDVVMSKDGYFTQRLEDISIRRGHPVESLGGITMDKKPTVTTTTAKLASSTVKGKEKGKVLVTVEPGGEKPVGDVVVKEGKEVVGTGELEARDRGETSIVLLKLPVGSHDLKVVYKGTKNFDASTSKTLTLTVKRR